MVTRVLRSPDDIERLSRFLGARTKYPITVSITQGDNQSGRQRRLSHMWFGDISRQLGDMTTQEVRADCKVTLGIPILCAENEAFRQQWEITTGPLSYQGQRKFVDVTDFPVTRLMNVKQMTAFMDAMHKTWTEAGIRLTDPEAAKYAEEFQQ